MTNEINGFRPRTLETGDGKPATGKPAKDAPAAVPAGPGTTSPTTDRVNLTETATRLAALDEQLAATPAEDSARIDSLRQAIAEGRYSTDSQKVADKLIALERNLFGKNT
ncbi:MAG: flagellar biosynthesis anti-sigma factor FlgM [Gammaproteobacteria bacterium]|nr:flagellar biosynthesis anti-sigma factor FlgM [Gammaproteobacteria bacterium]